MIRARVVGLPPILDELKSLASLFDLGGGLGEDLLDIATWEILASMDSETDPDGIPWPALSPGYEEWKSEVAPQAPMAVLHGVMKTFVEVAGERHQDPDHASMTYGVTPEARIEAVKFQEGGIVTGTRQPPRPFYALTTAAVIRVDARLGNLFDTAF